MWFDAFSDSPLKRCVQAGVQGHWVASNAVVCASSVRTLHHRVSRRLLINLQLHTGDVSQETQCRGLFLDNSQVQGTHGSSGPNHHSRSP
jgi:hypothetical protein